jgi:hypothetical protein
MMNQSLENVALRKQLLQARSRLGRLKLVYALNTIQDPQSWIHAGAGAVKKISLRSALTGLAFFGVGKSRLVSLLALAKRTLLFAGSIGSLRRKNSVVPNTKNESPSYANDDQ